MALSSSRFHYRGMICISTSGNHGERMGKISMSMVWRSIKRFVIHQTWRIKQVRYGCYVEHELAILYHAYLKRQPTGKTSPVIVHSQTGHWSIIWTIVASLP